MNRTDLSKANAAFWDVPCGDDLARRLGLGEISPQTLRRFDAEYFRNYAFLRRYVEAGTRQGGAVLEIGLGYGSLFEMITQAGSGCVYTGLDIASGPVDLMRRRIGWRDDGRGHRALVGSALDLPFADSSFSSVFAIGSLHHTGDTARAVTEAYRVLMPGGTLILMVYNRWGFTVVKEAMKRRLKRLLRRPAPDLFDHVRTLYDRDAGGQSAPHTDFHSRGDLSRMLRDFSHCHIRKEHITFGLDLPLYINMKGVEMYAGLRVSRDALLPLGRWYGDSLYAVARK